MSIEQVQAEMDAVVARHAPQSALDVLSVAVSVVARMIACVEDDTLRRALANEIGTHLPDAVERARVIAVSRLAAAGHA